MIRLTFIFSSLVPAVSALEFHFDPTKEATQPWIPSWASAFVQKTETGTQTLLNHMQANGVSLGPDQDDAEGSSSKKDKDDKDDDDKNSIMMNSDDIKKAEKMRDDEKTVEAMWKACENKPFSGGIWAQWKESRELLKTSRLQLELAKLVLGDTLERAQQEAYAKPLKANDKGHVPKSERLPDAKKKQMQAMRQKIAHFVQVVDEKMKTPTGESIRNARDVARRLVAAWAPHCIVGNTMCPELMVMDLNDCKASWLMKESLEIQVRASDFTELIGQKPKAGDPKKEYEKAQQKKKDQEKLRNAMTKANRGRKGLVQEGQDVIDNVGKAVDGVVDDVADVVGDVGNAVDDAASSVMGWIDGNNS